MQMADAPHSLEAMQYIVFQFDFQDYEQFIIEAPPGSIRFNNLIRVAQFYDALGVLVEGGIIDPEVVFELFPVPWGKVEPIIQGMRRELEWPDMFDHFESLAGLYKRWWEDKRKRLKLAGELPPPAARPRAVSVPRPTPAVARPTPPAVRPAVPGRPGVAPARPGAPAVGLPRRPAGLAGSPVARPAVRPAQGQKPPARPGGAQKPASRPGQQKPVSRPGQAHKPASRPGGQGSAKGKSSRPPTKQPQRPTTKGKTKAQRG